MKLWGVVTCHQNDLVVCPINAVDICNALKFIGLLGLWGQIVEVQVFNAPVLSVDKLASGSSGPG